MTATRAAVIAYAASIGADVTIDNAGRTLDVTVDAPAGMVWRDTGCAVIVESTYMGGAGWAAACYGAVLARMRPGLDVGVPVYGDAYANDEGGAK